MLNTFRTYRSVRKIAPGGFFGAKKAALLALMLAASCLFASAQRFNTDSLNTLTRSAVALKIDTVKVDSLLKKGLPLSRFQKALNAFSKPKKLIPKKAFLYSIVVPGLGQAYNKQAWKIPFVYAGIGVPIYFINYFKIRYNDYIVPLESCFRSDNGRLVVVKPTAMVYRRANDTTIELTIDQMKQAVDFYSRNRDFNYIVLLAVWTLNAVEANVAAHLKTFDESETLTWKLAPTVEQSMVAGQWAGLKLTVPIR